MEGKVMTKASVCVTLRVVLLSDWGEDCPIGQVYRDAREQALRIVRDKVGERTIEIVGEPSVTVVSVEFSGAPVGFCSSVTVPEGEAIGRDPDWRPEKSKEMDG